MRPSRKAAGTAVTLIQVKPGVLRAQAPRALLIRLAAAGLPALLFCSGLAAPAQTPAEKRVAAATQAIAQNGKSPQSYTDLAAALCERARETVRVDFFVQADATLKQAFQIAPGDYGAQKVQIAVLLGLHREPEALETAQILNRRVPDDVAVWGLLAETHFLLGHYAEAQKAAQWMMDLRSGNRAAFLPAAKLREVFGDLEGSAAFLEEALHRTPDDEVTQRAFLLTELARLQIVAGDQKRAAELLAQSFALYPDYPEALKYSALLEKDQGHSDAAASLLRRRYQQVRSAAALYDLAEALEQAGKSQSAQVAFRDFETQALGETMQPFNANRELIFYYADRRLNPVKALSVAMREKVARQDIFTRDAYAWALFRNGKLKEAKQQLDEALAVGTRDPGVLCHARRISAALGAGGGASRW